ncbi:MAG: oligosaccharide flippase family protein [Pseudomonadota bacterium]
MLSSRNLQWGLAWIVPIIAEAAAFGRSILLAWVIVPAELGQAMMLALTLRLVEMATDLGVERLIVQATGGDSPHLQADLHGISLLRGLVGALILLLLAPVLAHLFNGGPSTLTYCAIALAPLIRGAAHLDYRRAERTFSYVKLTVVEGGASLAMLASTLPALWLFADHRAMAVALIAHCCTFSLLSRLLAHRGYKATISMRAVKRSWTFGAPLIMNALLLFATFYADRLVVANAYSWSELALYGVALQLALLPAQIVGRAAASLVMPALRNATDHHSFLDVWTRTLSTHAVLAAAMFVGFTLVSPPLIQTLYSDALRPDFALALALAAASAFRILRTPYSQLAILSGRTADPARANLWRALALVPAIGCAAFGLPLVAIATCAAIGEAAATLRAAQLSRTSLQISTDQECFA